MDAIEYLFLVAPVAIVPLGLRILCRRSSRPFHQQRIWLAGWMLAALAAVISFRMEPGTLSASVAALWLLFAAATLAAGFIGLRNTKLDWSFRIASLAALAYLAGGAVWLVMSRAGMTPLGFAEPIVLLTAVHFHFAGFAATVIALCARSAISQRLGYAPSFSTAVVFGVMAAPALIAAAIVYSKPIQFASVILSALTLFSLSLTALAGLPHVRSRLAQILLTISSLSVLAGMSFAVFYALGELRNDLFVSIPRMAVWHGLLNGVGFGLCGLLGWNCESLRALNQEVRS